MKALQEFSSLQLPWKPTSSSSSLRSRSSIQWNEGIFIEEERRGGSCQETWRRRLWLIYRLVWQKELANQGADIRGGTGGAVTGQHALNRDYWGGGGVRKGEMTTGRGDGGWKRRGPTEREGRKKGVISLTAEIFYSFNSKNRFLVFIFVQFGNTDWTLSVLNEFSDLTVIWHSWASVPTLPAGGRCFKVSTELLWAAAAT